VSTSPTEQDARQEVIDRRLKDAGWDVTDPAQVVREAELFAPPANASGVSETGGEFGATSEFADYVLLGRDRLPISVVEAKRSSRDALAGKRQALDYADRIEAQYGRRPLIFLTNGSIIWFWDSEDAAPRKVSGFFTQYEG
jgi:type I restriction enzyme R subunit